MTDLHPLIYLGALWLLLVLAAIAKAAWDIRWLSKETDDERGMTRPKNNQGEASKNTPPENLPPR